MYFSYPQVESLGIGIIPLIIMNYFYLFIIISLFTFNLDAEEPSVALRKITQKEAILASSANLFSIDITLLKSVIYVERMMNYSWLDEALDIPLAKKGYDSSIGFCQIKMKTAYWIEVQLSDSTSKFYLGKMYSKILSVSKSPAEIITKLQNDSLNVIYAAAYLKIILNFWEKSGYLISNRPDIIGTLYSTGLYSSNGTIRKPNSTPKSNNFGKLTLDAFYFFNSSQFY